MACEDFELASTLALSIKEIDKDLIYLVPTGSKMEQAARKLDLKGYLNQFGTGEFDTIEG